MIKSTLRRARSALGLATVVALLGSAAVASGTLISPAEMPSASFKGSQYVDSRGCVFIRAGVGKRSTWVPRVSRNRKPICNSAVRIAPAPEPEVGAWTQRTPKRRVASKQVAIRNTVPVSAAPTYSASASVENRRVVMRSDGVQTYYTQSPCAQSRSGSARTMVSTYRNAVECGRAIMPGRVVGRSARMVRRSGLSTAQAAELNRFAPASTVIIPEHLNKTSAERGTDLGMPAGYKPIWGDDRLNPDRGIGTLGGMSKTDLIWTRTVPRRLVPREAGNK